MIKQIFKQIWVERRQNGWLLLELCVVFFFLLLMADFLWVKLKNYMEPKGFDIENTYMLKLKVLDPIAPDYVSPEQSTQKPADDLFNIIERIKLYPDIENVSVSIHSAPYSMGGYWNGLRVDSIVTPTIRCRQVTPSYFDVFRIRTSDGKPIQVEETGYKQIILTKDMAEYLYGDAHQAIGKEVNTENNPEEQANLSRITFVSNLLKRQEFLPYEGGYFEILSISKFGQWIETNDNITQVDVCVRVRPESTRHFQDNFISDMGDRLKENNVYVASVVSSDKLRDNVVGKMLRESVLLMVYVMIFVLITVFLGVFGAFWLRTRQRRSEIGIRMAMGANRGTIWRSSVIESLCLVSICILPAYLVYINFLYSEILDIARLSFTFGRTMIAFWTALSVMVLIIIGGISWPARRAASIQPVDALRDE